MNKRPYLAFFKNTLTIATFLVISLLATGCSHNRKPNDQSVRTEKLTIWRQPIDKKSDAKIFDQLIATYEKAHPTIKVEYRVFDPGDDYETAVLNSLAAGTGPDIWEIRNDELARHKDKLTSFPTDQPYSTTNLKKRFAATIAEEMVADKQLYGMPIAIDPLVLLVNTDHLAEINQKKLPTTWEETLQLANVLTRKADQTIFRPGLALGTASNVDRAAQLVELLMLQFGTQMVDSAHRKATFDLYNQAPTGTGFDYPGQNALLFYAGFARPDSGYQSWDSGQPYSTEVFATGNLSMMINYLSVVPQLRQLNPKLNLSYGPVPQRVVKTIPQEDLPGQVSDPVHTARYRALVASKPWEKLTASQQVAKRQQAWDFITLATAPGVSVAYGEANLLLPPQIFTQESATTGITQAANQINPYLKTWYKGRSPRVVDRVFTDLTRAITESNLALPETLNQAAQLVTTLLP